MSTSTDEQIRELGHRWADAERRGDVAALEALTTADFTLVGPRGFVLDKEQWLDRYRSGDFSTAALAWRDVDVREYGDAAVAIGTYAQEAAYQGSPSNGEFRSTHVFIRVLQILVACFLLYTWARGERIIRRSRSRSPMPRATLRSFRSASCRCSPRRAGRKLCASRCDRDRPDNREPAGCRDISRR